MILSLALSCLRQVLPGPTVNPVYPILGHRPPPSCGEIRRRQQVAVAADQVVGTSASAELVVIAAVADCPLSGVAFEDVSNVASAAAMRPVRIVAAAGPD
ncbi:hypothetical protein B0T24DRAFT_612521 [Lasiosphaeria ovina]|uniref:Uncharacterized protein n=1 Tax=Lasiosphaeria ovina TaxID=92902 RepID=A0AAE0NDT1_9PEZI|nr:hypothetical protein B0T24DRAFT_612521 [Lasiosphaeria ovina]